jgi:hypothetical protein
VLGSWEDRIFVGAGFMPAIKHHQRTFFGYLNAGIKPAPTENILLDCYELATLNEFATLNAREGGENPPLPRNCKRSLVARVRHCIG